MSLGGSRDGVHHEWGSLQPSAKGSALPGRHQSPAPRATHQLGHLVCTPICAQCHRGTEDCVPRSPDDGGHTQVTSAQHKSSRKQGGSTSSVWLFLGSGRKVRRARCPHGEIMSRDKGTLACKALAWEHIKGPLVDRTHSYSRTYPQTF